MLAAAISITSTTMHMIMTWFGTTTSPNRNRLHLPMMICPAHCTYTTLRFHHILDFRWVREQFRIHAKDQRRIDAFPAPTPDLRCKIVQRMQVVQNDVQIPFENVLPFIL